MTPKWIPVESRLPDSHGEFPGIEVLVARHGRVEMAYYDGAWHLWDDDGWNGYEEQDEHGRVSHWMPLPAPPKAPGAKSERDTALEALEKAFAAAHGLPAPDWSAVTPAEAKALQKSHRTPLAAIWKAAGKDTELASRVVSASIIKMVADNLTVADPRSIEKVAMSILGRYLSEERTGQ